MPKLLRIQSGVATIPDNQKSIEATLSFALAQDASKPYWVSPYAFLSFTIRDSANVFTKPSVGFVSGQILDATTLRFERGADNDPDIISLFGVTAPAIEIQWFVVEFMTGVYVLRGSKTLPTGSLTSYVFVASGEIPDNSYPIATMRTSSTNLDAGVFAALNVEPSLDRVGFSVGVNPAVNTIVEWQIVCFTDSETLVQKYTGTLAADDSADFINFSTTTTNTDKQFIGYLGYTFTPPPTVASGAVSEKFLAARIFSTHQASLYRDAGGASGDGPAAGYILYRVMFPNTGNRAEVRNIFFEMEAGETSEVRGVSGNPIDRPRTHMQLGAMYGQFVNSNEDTTTGALADVVGKLSFGPSDYQFTVSRNVTYLPTRGEVAIVTWDQNTISPAFGLVSVIPRTAPATGLVKYIGRATSVATALTRFSFVSSSPASAEVTSPGKALSAATALVVPHGLKAIVATGVTQGSFVRSTLARAQVQGSFQASAPSSAIVLGPANVGLTKAPYSQNSGVMVFNATNNARYDLLGDGLWHYMGDGIASRMEWGLDGNIRTFTASSGLAGAAITWSTANAGNSGDFVRRSGDQMYGSLAFKPVSPSGVERIELSTNAFGATFTLTKYTYLNSATELLTLNGVTAEFGPGTNSIYMDGGTAKGITWNTGSVNIWGGSVVLSNTSYYTNGQVYVGKHGDLTTSEPAIYNVSHFSNGNGVALVVHADYTRVNAKSAGNIYFSINYSNIATINASGLTVSAGGLTVSAVGITLSAGQFYASISASTYGAYSVNGAKNGYSGINFRNSSTNIGTFMADTSGAINGWYNAADNGWHWYWNNGTLTAGTVPVARISGLANSATITATDSNVGNQIALRDGNGNISMGRIAAFNVMGTNDQANFLQNDIWTYRSGSTNTSSLYLNAARDRHLQYNGTSYTFAGASIIVNGTTYTSSRDYKENIRALKAGEALGLLRKLKVRRFSFKEKYGNPQDEQVGFIYEEVREVLPEATSESPVLDSDEMYKTVNYAAIFSLMVEATQELHKQIDDLTLRLAKLEGNAASLPTPKEK